STSRRSAPPGPSPFVSQSTRCWVTGFTPAVVGTDTTQAISARASELRSVAMAVATPSSVTRALGDARVARVGNLVATGYLRILAYHGIPDPAAFAAQLDHLRDRYNPVSGADVANAFTRGSALPKRAVWVTFDDGRPEVVTHGLPLLAARSIPATMFVCPGV